MVELERPQPLLSRHNLEISAEVQYVRGHTNDPAPPPDNIFQIAWEFWSCCYLHCDFPRAANCSAIF
jgi:hypothetical protein